MGGGGIVWEVPNLFGTRDWFVEDNSPTDRWEGEWFLDDSSSFHILGLLSRRECSGGNVSDGEQQ